MPTPIPGIYILLSRSFYKNHANDSIDQSSGILCTVLPSPFGRYTAVDTAEISSDELNSNTPVCQKLGHAALVWAQLIQSTSWTKSYM